MTDYDMEKRIFTGEEKVKMAERIAEIHKDVSLLESEIKNIKSNYKAQVEKLETEGKELIWKIHDGYEMIYPEQKDLPGFDSQTHDELSDAIDEDVVSDIRDNKRLQKSLKKAMDKAPTLKTIAGFTDEEWEVALAWAETPSMFEKPVFLGDAG